MDLTIKQLFQIAITSHKEGKLQEAERLYETVLGVDPKHSDANHNLGIIFVSHGDHTKAVQYFRKAIENNFSQEEYWLSYINTLIKLGKILEAREAIYSAIEDGLKGDKVESLAKQLHPSSKLDFFYKYLKSLGVFNSHQEELLDENEEAIPLLTNSFLHWFETQEWNKMKLLELGSGGSTLYFSRFFKSVLSYETDSKWYQKLLRKIPNNVNLKKVNSILKALEDEDINNFNVILVDAGENRAKIIRLILNKKFNGIIFFDNSEWYRKSIGVLIKDKFLEVPFFGIKPVEDWVSCTSVLANPSTLVAILSPKWKKIPKLTSSITNNPWDNEDN